MHILYCTNENYIQPLCTSIASVLYHHPYDTLDITIAVKGDINRVRTAVHACRLQQNCHRFHFIAAIPVNQGIKDTLYYSLEMYQRYYAAELIPDASKILYLDCDTLVNAPLHQLWHTDIDQFGLAACAMPHARRMKTLCDLDDKPYFNSGVMLINADYWRRHDMSKILIKTTLAHADYIYEPDQDILNICFVDHWLELNPRWNVIRPYFIPHADFVDDQKHFDLVAKEARIIHYNSPHKPWHYMDNHPMKNLYLSFQRYTPYKDKKPKDLTLKNMLIKNLAPLLPTVIKKIIKGKKADKHKHVTLKKDHPPLKPITDD